MPLTSEPHRSFLATSHKELHDWREFRVWRPSEASPLTAPASPRSPREHLHGASLARRALPQTMDEYSLNIVPTGPWPPAPPSRSLPALPHVDSVARDTPLAGGNKAAAHVRCDPVD